MSAPRATKGTSLKELTLRGIIIGGIITLVFTAANVYLGLGLRVKMCVWLGVSRGLDLAFLNAD